MILHRLDEALLEDKGAYINLELGYINVAGEVYYVAYYEWYRAQFVCTKETTVGSAYIAHLVGTIHWFSQRRYPLYRWLNKHHLMCTPKGKVPVLTDLLPFILCQRVFYSIKYRITFKQLKSVYKEAGISEWVGESSETKKKRPTQRSKQYDLHNTVQGRHQE